MKVVLSYNNLVLMFLSFFAVLNIFPIFKLLPFFNYLSFVFIAFYLFIVLHRKDRSYMKQDLDLLVTYFLIGISCLICFATRNYSTGLNYITFIFFPLLISFSKIYLNDRKLLNKLFTIFLIALIFTGITTVGNLILDPYASRLAQIKESASFGYLLKGTGGYGFIYLCSICLISLLPSLHNLHKYSLNSKIFLVLLSIIMFMAIMLSNFTIAYMIFFIGIGVFYIQIYPIRTSAIFGVIFIIFLMSFSFLQSIDIFTIKFENMNLVKLLEIFNYLSSQEVGVYSSGRLERYQESLFGIVNYFPYGMANSPSINVLEEYGYGQHSFFLDTLALFGIPLGLFIIFSIFGSLFRLKFKYKLCIYSFRASLVAFFLMCFLNIISLENIMSVAIIAPVILAKLENDFYHIS